MRGRRLRAEWSEQQLRAFQERLRAWMAERDLDPQTLGELLATGVMASWCASDASHRAYLGDPEATRVPSVPFVERLEQAGFSGNGGDEPVFPAELHPVVSGVVAEASIAPGTVVPGQPRQCPECAAEVHEGRHYPARTWYVFAHPRQKYCCPKHRRAVYRRQKRSKET